jgi:uncharacterized protein
MLLRHKIMNYLRFVLISLFISGFTHAYDWDEEFKRLEILANEGDADAQNMLGIRYNNAPRILRDYEKAAYWYGRAVLQQNDEALCNLAQLYRFGDGVK